MEKLTIARQTAARAQMTLIEVLKESPTPIVRDAAIQRFEYTFEAVWKLLKVFLLEHHGIDIGSPKSSFREALKVAMLTPEQVEQALLMTQDRNLTSHTYIEAIANTVYQRLGAHADLMQEIIDKTS